MIKNYTPQSKEKLPWHYPLYIISGVALAALGQFHPRFSDLVCAIFLIIWCLIGLRRRIPGAYGMLILAASIGAVDDITLLGLATFAVIVIAIFESRSYNVFLRYQDLRPLRNELRDNEYQQGVMHRHIGRYPILLNMCSNLASAQERGQFAQLLVHYVKSLVPHYEHIAVSSLQDNIIKPYYSIDSSGKTDIDFSIRFAEFVFEEGKSLIHRSGDTVEITLPLIVEDNKCDSVLSIHFNSKGLDDNLLIELLKSLGKIAGLSLASVLLVEKARSYALLDDLTGLYGQHEFLRRLREFISLQRRLGGIVGVIMCDMDHLKSFNDNYGHQVGDEALKKIGQTIKSSLPEHAIACRYGGEEFTIAISPECQEETEDIAHRIHKNIESLKLDNGAQLTASLGWALLSRQDDDFRSLLNRADEACYEAKHNGRNQVQAAL